jgi:hypothetical protein
MDFPFPQPLRIYPAESGIDVGVVLKDSSMEPFRLPLSVENLSFLRVEQGETIKLVSTIDSGVVVLSGEKHMLSPKELIRFAKSSGQIRNLRLGGAGLSLEFHGHVQGAAADGRTNMMPTYLAWLVFKLGTPMLLVVVGLYALIGLSITWFRR